jgi:hypothetical protein
MTFEVLQIIKNVVGLHPFGVRPLIISYLWRYFALCCATKGDATAHTSLSVIKSLFQSKFHFKLGVQISFFVSLFFHSNPLLTTWHEPDYVMINVVQVSLDLNYAFDCELFHINPRIESIKAKFFFPQNLHCIGISKHCEYIMIIIRFFECLTLRYRDSIWNRVAVYGDSVFLHPL